MKNEHFRYSRRGFTIIELLVVMSIIVVLVSILLPVIGKARYQAKITKCASNLGQICAAMTNYASSNDGLFPDDDIVGGQTQCNLWDSSPIFCNALISQGVPPLTFICPFVNPDDAEAVYGGPNSWFYIITYNIWIPRLDGAVTIPPSPPSLAPPGQSAFPFAFPNPPPTVPFAGPKRLRDPVGQTNPIISDMVSSSGLTPPANPRVDASNNPYGIGMYHIDNGRLMGTNQGFADGHVEIHSPESLRPYYYGNYWNWR